MRPSRSTTRHFPFLALGEWVSMLRALCQEMEMHAINLNGESESRPEDQGNKPHYILVPCKFFGAFLPRWQKYNLQKCCNKLRKVLGRYFSVIFHFSSPFFLPRFFYLPSILAPKPWISKLVWSNLDWIRLLIFLARRFSISGSDVEKKLSTLTSACHD